MELQWKPTPAAPQVALALRRGDIVLIGNEHSGLVNALERIDHYLQEYGKGGTARRAESHALGHAYQ